ncbi:hypothetical protein SCHPADRAFT_663702 [Schizopora paradoxa]|uniref:Uncharacterized protein n=1 Tax=Schizopora paradoxa TaxID=27342 RepID=A0A0H2R6Z1_9AGAM|nr:hypothetical protein SCHPADRAFT_663702 [Schizopora paradoxa]
MGDLRASGSLAGRAERKEPERTSVCSGISSRMISGVFFLLSVCSFQSRSDFFFTSALTGALKASLSGFFLLIFLFSCPVASNF